MYETVINDPYKNCKTDKRLPIQMKFLIQSISRKENGRFKKLRKLLYHPVVNRAVINVLRKSQKRDVGTRFIWSKGKVIISVSIKISRWPGLFWNPASFQSVLRSLFIPFLNQHPPPYRQAFERILWWSSESA